MAGVSNKSKLLTKSYDILFDGALLSSTRASLVVELIKYFLYERQQIPLPVDELRYRLAHASPFPGPVSLSTSTLLPNQSSINTRNPGTSTNGTCKLSSDLNNLAKGSKIKSSHDRKAECLVSDLTQMFNNLQKAFESCPEIEQVAVILGGTVISPKESYLIKFPPPCPDADYLPLGSCKRALFRQIIGEDALGFMKSNISPTNMMLLVSAPRSCPLTGFLPKQSLCSPRTGAIISFNFHCNYSVPICHDLTFADGDFEMSGIELLDFCHCEKSGFPLSDEDHTVKNHTLVTLPCHSHIGLGSEASGSTSDDFRIHSRLAKLKASSEDEVGADDGCVSKQVSAGTSPSISMLNVHQQKKVNCFCSHQKKSEKKDQQNGSLTKSLMQPPADMKDCIVDSSKQLSNCSQSRLGSQITCDTSLSFSKKPDLTSVTQPLAIATKPIPKDMDCIWYQSTLVIKGYKNQNLTHGIGSFKYC